MNKLTKIAIIGYGFVGKAVEFGFKNTSNDIMIVDPYKGFHDLDDLEAYVPDVTFVCVPSPMGNDSGGIDANIIRDVILKLEQFPSGMVVIKSTITPDLAEEFTRYKRFVYNPEFLIERNAFDNFINPAFHVFGGRYEYTKRLQTFYKYNSNCNPAPMHHMKAGEASMVKYGINSFLASKVVWFNQYKDYVESNGGRYNIVSNVIGSDTRIGHSHMTVPGFDGKKGFGGSCFPKDTNALYKNSNEDLLSVLKSVIDANNRYRSVYELDDREKEQNISFKIK